MSSRHVVIGAGAVGTALASELVRRGEQVRVVGRSGHSSAVGVTDVVAGDVADAAFLRGAVAGSAVVYQCAQPKYHRWLEEFAALQRGILDAAAATDARVVIADNLYGYGDPHGAVISEASPRDPRTAKGKLRAQMAAEALADDRIQVALARPSNYVGPGYDLFGSMVVRRALRGRSIQLFGKPDVAHSFSYVPDVGVAMAVLGASEAAWGRAWITTVAPAMDQATLAQLVWRAAGRTGEARLSVITRRAAAALGFVVPDLRAMLELWYEFNAPFVVDSSEFEHTFDVRPTPIEDAVAATVEWYRTR